MPKNKELGLLDYYQNTPLLLCTVFTLSVIKKEVTEIKLNSQFIKQTLRTKFNVFFEKHKTGID